MSLDKVYLTKLKKDSLDYSEKRRNVIKQSDDALHVSKRAIFAMHRDDLKEAKLKLQEAGKLLKQLEKKYSKDERLSTEGAFNAAKEEFVEATLFYQFQTGGKIGQISGLIVSTETYVGGLCDLPGELLRYAIKLATEGEVKIVKKYAEIAQEIVGELIEFNLTKYSRHKFDQAKNAVQRLEQVVYEVSIRK